MQIRGRVAKLSGVKSQSRCIGGASPLRGWAWASVVALGCLGAASAAEGQAGGVSTPSPSTPAVKQESPDATGGAAVSDRPKPQAVMVGSRLPQRVRRQGALSDSGSPVYVVEQEEIRRSGAVTTAQVLRRLPFAR